MCLEGILVESREGEFLEGVDFGGWRVRVFRIYLRKSAFFKKSVNLKRGRCLIKIILFLLEELLVS